MKITKIECIPYTIPYRQPIVAASGTLDAAEHVLIRVHTDAGLVGLSEAVVRSFVYGESQASIVEAVRLWFEPALIGADPFAVEENRARTAWIIANNTVHGAIDIACHDLRGKATGMPSWRLLGGSGKAMRVSHLLAMDNADEYGDAAVEAVSRYGISAFKVKTGGDLRKDISKVAAVRKAVGEAPMIFVDSNHGWSAEQAIRALTAMAEYGVDLVEEPSPASDLIGRQRLAQHVPVHVMADESAPNLSEAARELSTGSSRALSIKVTRTGFTESAKLVALAEGLGARTLIGSQADGMIGAAAGLAFGSAFPRLACEPGELDFYTILSDQLVVDYLEVKGGMLTPSSKPGIGVEIDEKKLGRYRIDGK